MILSLDDIPRYDPALPPIAIYRNEFFFLSNWFEEPVFFRGHWFRWNEGAFVYAKTMNADKLKQILACKHPAEALKIGRKRDVPLVPGWDETKKFEVMRELLASKFNNPLLRDQLVRTYPRRLIEGHAGNKVWGMVQLPDGSWEGENHLAEMQMDLRRLFIFEDRMRSARRIALINGFLPKGDPHV